MKEPNVKAQEVHCSVSTKFHSDTVESSAKASSFLVSVPLSKTSISTPRCISDYYLPLDFEDLVSSTESSLSPNSGQSSLSPVPYTSSDSREFSSAPGGSFTGL